jgi:NadR type nicotinamide-nucleotide adenylyltransferase
LKKVAITGPESTGKSMLAQQLAAHFHTVFVPEYAREYIDKLGRPYEYGDILNIAKGQIENEISLYPKADKFIFCDTELIVTKIWSENAFKRSDEWIIQNIKEHPYDLYLLMDIDLPWEYDPQREHPHLREFFFNWYQNELKNYGFPFEIISGTGGSRLKNAIEKIQNFFGF